MEAHLCVRNNSYLIFVRNFQKNEPERRSGAFWSNSNPVLNDCLQHLSSLILTIITSLLLYVELTTDVKYDVSEIIEQR